MFLQKLSLFNFKNYSQAEFEFCPKVNCLIGGNGVGKTNVLDAVHYLSLCKSCINPVDSQNVRYGCDGFVIQGEYLRDSKPENLSCGVKVHQKKVFKRNRKEYERLADHIGLFPLVMVSPMDNGLIAAGSEERRRFMNEVISQYDAAYLNQVMQYNRTLLQRNTLLKQADGRAVDASVLDALDMQLALYGTQIHAAREAFCQALVPIFQQYYETVSGREETVTLTYRSQLQDHDLYTLLKQSDRDKLLGFTTCGIHRDDLLLEMNGFHIRRSGSQGQQKTYLTALKLADYAFIRQHGPVRPLLLLDDIFDKFDAARVNRLMQIVSGADFGQVLITDTSPDRIGPMLSAMDCPSTLIRIEKNSPAAAD